MDVEVSKNKNISRWVDRENLIYVDETESKTVHNDEEGDQKRKKKRDTKWSKMKT